MVPEGEKEGSVLTTVLEPLPQPQTFERWWVGGGMRECNLSAALRLYTVKIIF